MSEEKKFDEIQSAKHYNVHPSGIECIEIMVYLPTALATALKYMWRYEDKESPEKDLQKALYYIEKCEQMNPRYLKLAFRLSRNMFAKDNHELMKKLDVVIDHEENKHRKKFLLAIASMMSDALTEEKAVQAIGYLKAPIEMAAYDC